MPRGSRCGSGNEGDCGLSGTNITLKEAQHRRARCQVGEDLVNRAALVSGPGCCALCLGATDATQDCRFDSGSFARRRLDAEGAVTCAATTAMHQRNLHRQ